MEHAVYRPPPVRHALLLRVQQSLTNVQRGRDGGSDGPRGRPRHDVRLGVVPSLRVQVFLAQFVRDEVDGLEGDVHCKLRGVAAVKGTRALSSQHPLQTVCYVLVGAVVHLHPLLDHCCSIQNGNNTHALP